MCEERAGEDRKPNVKQENSDFSREKENIFLVLLRKPAH